MPLDPDKTKELFKKIPEEFYTDILANYRGSIDGSSVCREAYNGGDYRIDLLERDKQKNIIIYEAKKVPEKKNIRACFYHALGQILFYSTLVRGKHKRRIWLIVNFDFDLAKELKYKLIFEHAYTALGASVLVTHWCDAMALKRTSGYQTVSNKISLARDLLKPLQTPAEESVPLLWESLRPLPDMSSPISVGDSP